jgi:hypothetical protein
MKGCRTIGIVVIALLAAIFLAGGAQAHGTRAHHHASGASAVAGVDLAGESAHDRFAVWETADIGPASDLCPQSAAGCCSQHCCVGDTIAVRASAPARQIGRPADAGPIDTPREQTLDGVLRPPCR